MPFDSATSELRRRSGDVAASFGKVFQIGRFVEVARIASVQPRSHLLSGSVRTNVAAAGLYPVRGLAGTTYVKPDGVASEIFFTSVNDDIAGTGAQKVKVAALDSSNVETVTEYSANGAGSGIVSIGSPKRVNGIWVSQAGSNKANVGNITVRRTSDTVGYIRVLGLTDDSVSHELRYTVPADHVAVLCDIRIAQSDLLPCARWLYTNQDPEGNVHTDVIYRYRLFITPNTSEQGDERMKSEVPVLFNAGADIEVFVESFSAAGITVAGTMSLTVFKLNN